MRHLDFGDQKAVRNAFTAFKGNPPLWSSADGAAASAELRKHLVEARRTNGGVMPPLAIADTRRASSSLQV